MLNLPACGVGDDGEVGENIANIDEKLNLKLEIAGHNFDGTAPGRRRVG